MNKKKAKKALLRLVRAEGVLEFDGKGRVRAKRPFGLPTAWTNLSDDTFDMAVRLLADEDAP